MKGLRAALLAVLAGVSARAASQRIQVFVPTPTPTHRADIGYVAPSVANLPVHGPVRLDFGAAWDGEKVIRTFSVTSNGKGFLGAEIPRGPFHIVEYRELGLPVRSANGQKVGVTVKTRITYRDDESRSLSWQIDPDTQVQIDVAFNPKFDLASMGAGDKNLTLTVRGPGPWGGWQMGIPLHGVFHGLRLMPTILVKDREPVIRRPADSVDVGLDVISPGSPASGTLRGVSPPAGVTVDPIAVSVGAGGTTSTKVRVHASTVVPADGVVREVGLQLDGTNAAKAGFALVVVPDHVVVSRMVPECSLRNAYVSLTAYPDHLALLVQGASGNVAEDRTARFQVTLNGREIMWANLHLPPAGIGPVLPTKATFDTRRLPLDFLSNYTGGDYPALVRGGVAFGCRVD